MRAWHDAYWDGVRRRHRGTPGGPRRRVVELLKDGADPGRDDTPPPGHHRWSRTARKLREGGGRVLADGTAIDLRRPSRRLPAAAGLDDGETSTLVVAPVRHARGTTGESASSQYFVATYHAVGTGRRRCPRFSRQFTLAATARHHVDHPFERCPLYAAMLAGPFDCRPVPAPACRPAAGTRCPSTTPRLQPPRRRRSVRSSSSPSSPAPATSSCWMRCPTSIPYIETGWSTASSPSARTSPTSPAAHAGAERSERRRHPRASVERRRLLAEFLADRQLAGSRVPARHPRPRPADQAAAGPASDVGAPANCPPPGSRVRTFRHLSSSFAEGQNSLSAATAAAGRRSGHGLWPQTSSRARRAPPRCCTWTARDQRAADLVGARGLQRNPDRGVYVRAHVRRLWRPYRPRGGAHVDDKIISRTSARTCRKVAEALVR